MSTGHKQVLRFLSFSLSAPEHWAARGNSENINKQCQQFPVSLAKLLLILLPLLLFSYLRSLYSLSSVTIHASLGHIHLELSISVSTSGQANSITRQCVKGGNLSG